MEVPTEEGTYVVVILSHRPQLKVVELIENLGTETLEVWCILADEGLPLSTVSNWIAKVDLSVYALEVA